LKTSRIERNLALWSDQVELTRVMRDSTLDLAQTVFMIAERQAVFLQVVDCLSNPAAGIVVKASGARIIYSNDFFPIPEAVETFGVGSAAVFDFKATEGLTIEAFRGDVRVATAKVGVGQGEVVYLKLFPTGSF
jgi:hypothetical protein